MADRDSPQSILHKRWDERFVYLVLVYLDDMISAEEFQELQEHLRQDASMRDVFVALCLQMCQIAELKNRRLDPESAIEHNLSVLSAEPGQPGGFSVEVPLVEMIKEDELIIAAHAGTLVHHHRGSGSSAQGERLRPSSPTAAG